MTLDFKFEHINFGETYLSTQSHPIYRYLWIDHAGAHNKNVGRNGNTHSSIYLLTNNSIPLFLPQCHSSNAWESTVLKMFSEFNQSLSFLWLSHQLCYRDHMRTIARLSCLPPSNPSTNTHVSESCLKLTVCPLFCFKASTVFQNTWNTICI